MNLKERILLAVMEFGVGSIVEGKVTGITKFGAFVALPEGKSGLVHISEIAYTYVNYVKEHLKEAVEVKKFGFKIPTQVKQVYLNLRKMLVRQIMFLNVLLMK